MSACQQASPRCHHRRVPALETHCQGSHTRKSLYGRHNRRHVLPSGHVRRVLFILHDPRIECHYLQLVDVPLLLHLGLPLSVSLFTIALHLLDLGIESVLPALESLHPGLLLPRLLFQLLLLWLKIRDGALPLRRLIFLHLCIVSLERPHTIVPIAVSLLQLLPVLSFLLHESSCQLLTTA
ncbi:hypothetical protein MRS44_016566 [Fusarium solani]|uniref:uncharacterized protein n=1 Tax=Fusarium solani TaxID=169388 RepID=UPI0032C3FD78|nr:hypothetical protein MRS44_016566 [Fusarium solani]